MHIKWQSITRKPSPLYPRYSPHVCVDMHSLIQFSTILKSICDVLCIVVDSSKLFKSVPNDKNPNFIVFVIRLDLRRDTQYDPPDSKLEIPPNTFIDLLSAPSRFLGLSSNLVLVMLPQSFGASQSGSDEPVATNIFSRFR